MYELSPLSFWIAVTVFTATYIVIISEKIHRVVVALSGATLMILLGVLNQENAIEGVDFNTLGLLIGMMIIVNIARKSGMFECVAIWAAKAVKGNPIACFLLLGTITAVFSAFLDNVTTVLLMVPVMLVVASNLKVHPMPFFIGSVLLSNIGGTATLIGDPPNILVGSAAKIPFNDFLIHLGPIVLIVLTVTLGILYVLYRKQLVTTPEARATVMQFQPLQAITDWPLLWKSLAVIGLVIIGFFTHGSTHLEGATIALTGAALLLLFTMHEPEEYLREIEWSTIFFFTGLFIVVAGLEHVGAISLLAGRLLELTGGNPLATTLSLLWGSAIFSAIIDNIPFVATMIPLIKEIGTLSAGSIDISILWWALLLGADLGGNATIIGASANVVVCGIAEKNGHKITFLHYMKTAIPLTFIAICLCTAYLYLRYFT